MFKSKLTKSQQRIGISRSGKPRAKSPIKIIPAHGVKPRTLGLNRNYKAPKNIDDLVQSKILTYAKNTTMKEKQTTLNKNAELHNISTISKENDLESLGTVINNNKLSFDKTMNKVTNPVSESASYPPSEVSRSNENPHIQSMNQITGSLVMSHTIHDTPKVVDKSSENEDVSISYSPLDVLASSPNTEKQENEKVVKAKRLILGSRRNIQNSSTTDVKKNISTTFNAKITSTMKLKKFSRLSLKKSRTLELTDDNEEEEIKANKKKAKIKSFDSNTSLVSNFSDCSVILDRLPQDIVEAKKETYNEQTTISEEEEIVEFTELNQNVPNSNKKQLIDYIESLNQLSKSKNVDLHALKQSIIYKKMHDIKDLTARTRIWKSGCKLAMTDLLIRLQEVVQSNMTMNDLLKQLNVPEHILKYDYETEELI